LRALVLRFSAIGDVSLILPAVLKVLELNPLLEVTLVSKPFFAPLFSEIPRLQFFGVDLSEYSGIGGLTRLSQLLYRKIEPDLYLDLHDSLRSNLIGLYMLISGVKTFHIDKGRAQKKELTRKRNKVLKPLKHTVSRYLDVFSTAGLKVPNGSVLSGLEDSGVEFARCLPAGFSKVANPGLEGTVRIGFAPFAGLPLKELPIYKGAELVSALLEKYPKLDLVFFAARSDEPRLNQLIRDASAKQGAGPGQTLELATGVAPGLDSELRLIASLDLMISMDSANLHFAALCGIRVMGIYGTTHPYLGFAPYGQERTGTFGHNTLPCRPCTVYGKGVCYRGDFACMNDLSISSMLDKVADQLEN